MKQHKISGNLTVGRNLKVEGWLDAKNIKNPCKGLFASVEKLRETYPYPLPGWWALVGNALPARLMQVEEREWVDTGSDWNFTSLPFDLYDRQFQAMDASIARVANLFRPYIVNDGETTIVETTETITHEVEVPNEDGVIPTTNLLDTDDLLYGYDISSGKLHETPVGIMSNLIAVTPGTTYTIENVCFYADKVFVAFYNSSGNYIGRVGFVPETKDTQGVTTSGTQYYGCAIKTIMVCPATVENQAYTHCRVVLQAQIGSSDSVAMGDLENARIYEGTEWIDPSLASGGTHIETVTETITHVNEVRGERLDLSGVCKCGVAKKIKVLSIGNSYSRDCLSYLPYLMRDLSDINVELGILYIGGCTLDQHYANALANNHSYIFDYNSGDGTAWSQEAGYSLLQALDAKEWDIVVLQQASTSAYNSTSYGNLENLIDWIMQHATYPLKFGWLLTPARPGNLTHDAIETNFEYAAEIAEDLMPTTLIDFVIPAGTAIQNARTTALCALGDGGELVASDRIHLQEGLPCMLAAYSSALSLLSLCGHGYRSIAGSTTRATAAWLQSKNIPEVNGTAVEGTTAEYLLAQKCAITAHKYPFEVREC